MINFLENVTLNQVIWSVIFALIAVAVFIFLNRLRDTVVSKITGDDEQTVRKKAFVTLISNVLKVITSVVIVLTILQINGINVSSLIASLGIAGAIVGLAWQDILKDIIQGMRILTDGFFSVGDCVRYGGNDYVVIGFTIRTTKMKNIVTSDVISICNRNINEMSVLSGLMLLNIGLSYYDDPEVINQALEDCSKEIKKIKGVKKCVYAGTNGFNSSTVDYSIKITCSPLIREDVRRAALALIRKKLMECDITIPFNQLDVHMS